MGKRCVLSPDDKTSINLQLLVQADLQLLQGVLEKWKKGEEIQDPRLSAHPTLGFLAELLKQNLNPVPLRSLLRIVLDRFQGNLALLEDPYVEMEFWDTYAYFHSRSFVPRRKQCWRIHFFRHKKEEGTAIGDGLINSLLSGVAQSEIEEQGFTYLGFTTIRPSTSFNLGRTAVLFDSDPGGRARSGGDDLEANGNPFCKGSGEQVANVAASKLALSTVPFLQQDPIVGMCATASLWVSSQVLASKFDLHKYPYIDVSRQATQPTLAPFVATPPDDNSDFARGLTVPEICGALVRTGATPLVVVPRLFKDKGHGVAHVRDQIYTFVESELPVIVCLSRDKGPGHAVATIGHLQPDVHSVGDVRALKVAMAYPRGSDEQFLVSLSVKRYYVHNDGYGPFDRLDFLDPSEVPAAYKNMYCPVRLSRDNNQIYDLGFLVVPMPPYVKNRPDAIMQDASYRFAQLLHKKGFELAGRKLLWRMLLVKGSRFKQSLRERRWPDSLVRKYAEVHLPKYIWLCEVTAVDEDDVERTLSSSTRSIHGEFIYDTTTAYYNTRAVVQRFGRYFITDSRIHELERAEMKDALAQSLVGEASWQDGLPCFTGHAQV